MSGKWAGDALLEMARAYQPACVLLAAADAEDLHKALMQINEADKFYKDNVGLRDVKRLIRSAGYIPS